MHIESFKEELTGVLLFNNRVTVNLIISPGIQNS